MDREACNLLELEGLVSFEEIDSFEELKSSTLNSGKILKPLALSDNSKRKSPSSTVSKKKIKSKPCVSVNNNDENIALPHWEYLNLPKEIMHAVFDLKFEKPTIIQEAVLEALCNSPKLDVIASAATVFLS